MFQVEELLDLTATVRGEATGYAQMADGHCSDSCCCCCCGCSCSDAGGGRDDELPT